MTVTTAEEPMASRQGSTGRRLWTAIAIIVGVLVVTDVVAQGLDRAIGGNQPGGVGGSSYATGGDGLAAFGSLLTHYGHDVTRQRGPIAVRPPPNDATVFVLEPATLTADDAHALVQFVTDGGRLVIGGASPYYLTEISDDPPSWQSAGASSWTTIDPALAGVHDVESSGTGSWTAPGRGHPLVRAGERSLVTRDAVGHGVIYFLADLSPLENAYLDAGDNAAFALALSGDAGRPTVFAEGVHGYGASRGLAAIPHRWKVALILLGIAALAFVWSRARRFGPPDRNARDLPPARAAYVDAVSISLERTRDRAGALAPAQRWARDRLAGRAALGPNANESELKAVARSLGCPDDEIAALFAPVTDDAGVLALGSAVARVGDGNGDGRTR